MKKKGSFVTFVNSDKVYKFTSLQNACILLATKITSRKLISSAVYKVYKVDNSYQMHEEVAMSTNMKLLPILHFLLINSIYNNASLYLSYLRRTIDVCYMTTIHIFEKKLTKVFLVLLIMFF
ncbi:hypothetical protein BDC45DRAFT_532356 [Circinella umbellata]|nr:hypothetical protein BDC45DRAFT_532356 [Circinella umbellata]